MVTAVKTSASDFAKQQRKQSVNVPYQEPKRLSKIGQWMRDNPGGIIEYVDWRAVNR
jgi:hypothetical protein